MHRKFEILLRHIADPEEIRGDYASRMEKVIGDIAREADLRQIQHRLVDPRRPNLDAIEAYLGFRGKSESSR